MPKIKDLLGLQDCGVLFLRDAIPNDTENSMQIDDVDAREFAFRSLTKEENRLNDIARKKLSKLEFQVYDLAR
jgi:hypothetical protein